MVHCLPLHKHADMCKSAIKGIKKKKNNYAFLVWKTNEIYQFQENLLQFS